MIEWQVWLREFDEISDNGKAAIAALDDLHIRGERTRSLLLPIVTEAVLMARRKVTRQHERTVPIDSIYDGQTTLSARQALLDQSFALGDGRYVTWGEATEADHLARINILAAHIEGVQKTIDQHETAISFIHQRGVSCLGEIEVAA